MPKIFERLVKQLKGKVANPYAVATSQLQKHGVLKKGTRTLTAKGKKRNKMTPSQRAKSRMVKYRGKKASDYKYNRKTNLATLRKRK